MNYVFMILTLIVLFFFTRSLFMLMFSMDNYNVHRKRLKQLKFQKKEEADLGDLIDTVTKPALTYLIPKIKFKDLEQLDRDLRMAKWDKYFTPIKYRAFDMTLKIAGVTAFLILYNVSVGFALVWGLALCFLMPFLFSNNIKERKQKLLNDFPDFIRITEGYLSANVPFSQAVSESIRYVGEDWKPILQNFVVQCDVKSIEEALEILKEDVDLFEVREFVALVKLTLESGGDARESFSAQADKIREMQLDMIALKIGKRQMMGVALQAPLLLCNLAVFGLPTIASMKDFSSM